MPMPVSRMQRVFGSSKSMVTRTGGWGVFQSVGQHLLHNKEKPLLICHYPGVEGLVIQTDFTADKLPGKFPHGPA